MRISARAAAALGLAAAYWAGAAAAADAVSCAPRDLGFDNAAVGWKHIPLSKLKRDTVYTLARDAGRSVLRADADGSASMYAAAIEPPLRGPALLSWEWATDAAVPGADNRQKSREDAPLRVIVTFDGDVKDLPDAEQKRYARAKRLSGRDAPYATLIYVWSEQIPVGTVVPSAHTGQVKMLVASSAADGLGRWLSLRRDLAQDYRLAYGKAPGPIIGVAVMTDTDNTGTKASGRYASLKLACGG